MSHLLFFGALLYVTYLVIMFAIVNIKKDTSIGNFTWGGGVLLMAVYTYVFASAFLMRQTVVTLMLACWCSRLVYYVYARYKKGADPRYVAWLSKYDNYLTALFFSAGWIFILNGFFALVMAVPALLVNTNNVQYLFGMLDLIGLVVWLIGFATESAADLQLYNFLKDPAHKGQVCDQGLWRYSRHPNYFGEILLWWGVFIVASSAPYGICAIIAPCAISFSLIFVTGIPWLEKAMESNAAYQEYKRRTSMLIPWPPKK